LWSSRAHQRSRFSARVSVRHIHHTPVDYPHQKFSRSANISGHPEAEQDLFCSVRNIFLIRAEQVRAGRQSPRFGLAGNQGWRSMNTNPAEDLSLRQVKVAKRWFRTIAYHGNLQTCPLDSLDGGLVA